MYLSREKIGWKYPTIGDLVVMARPALGPTVVDAALAGLGQSVAAGLANRVARGPRIRRRVTYPIAVYSLFFGGPAAAGGLYSRVCACRVPLCRRCPGCSGARIRRSPLQVHAGLFDTHLDDVADRHADAAAEPRRTRQAQEC